MENTRVRREYFAAVHDGVRPTAQSSPVDISSECLRAVAPSGDLVALLREAVVSKAGDGKLRQCLEIWRDDRLEQSWDLAQFDAHGPIHTNDIFGCFEFSPDERHLVYVAEPSPAKKRSLLQLGLNAAETTPDESREFDFVEDWGEQLDGKRQPLVCVFNVSWEIDGPDPSPIRVINQPTDCSIGQVTWVSSKQLVGVAWSHKPRRLGLKYNPNRPSRLFQINLSPVQCEWIGEDGGAVSSPRYHGPSKRLAYLSCDILGPPLFRVVVLDTVTGSSREIRPKIGADVYLGMYQQTLIERCWSPDGRHLVLTTPFKSSVQSYILDLDEQRVTRLSVPDECTGGIVLDAAGDYLLLNGVCLTRPDRLYVGRIDWRAVDGPLQWVRLGSGDGLPPGRPLESHLHTLRRPDGTEYEATLVYGRSDEGGGAEVEKLGLVVYPHGGPHSVWTDQFQRCIWFFNQLNLAVLLVNYCGSPGFGEAALKSQPGKAGVLDVADVHQATVRALQVHASLLDADCVFLYGGSHGGLLGAHLVGQQRDFYRAAALRNPVIDLNSMADGSDSPDWVVIQAGLGDGVRLEDGLSTPKTLAAKWRHSPIRYVHLVRAPVLLLVGSMDRRVPHSQSMVYYRALKLHGKIVRLFSYDDCHPLNQVASDMDSTVNAALWFQQYSTSRIHVKTDSICNGH